MNNPSAFPRSIHVGSLHVGDEVGITLRDYFAAKAMAAYLANDRILQYASANRGSMEVEHYFSSLAYDLADAMLKMREL